MFHHHHLLDFGDWWMTRNTLSPIPSLSSSINSFIHFLVQFNSIQFRQGRLPAVEAGAARARRDDPQRRQPPRGLLGARQTARRRHAALLRRRAVVCGSLAPWSPPRARQTRGQSVSQSVRPSVRPSAWLAHQSNPSRLNFMMNTTT